MRGGTTRAYPPKYEFPAQRDSEFVLISFSTVFAGKPIIDEFLWPRNCRDVLQMK